MVLTPFGGVTKDLEKEGYSLQCSTHRKETFWGMDSLFRAPVRMRYETILWEPIQKQKDVSGVEIQT